MNNTIKTIYERRAIRKFEPKSVDRTIIEEIIDAGRMAPSAMNEQAWKFYILTNKEDIKAFSRAIKTGVVKGVLKMGIKQLCKMIISVIHFPKSGNVAKAKDMIFYEAPVVIFITSPRANEWGGLDTGMCAQNIMLAAKSLGLDTCPIGSAKYVEDTKLFSKLNIPKTEKVELAIILGYGSEHSVAHERVKNNLTYID